MVTLVTINLSLSFGASFPAAPLKQRYGRVVILPVYPVSRRCTPEEMFLGRAGKTATGWLPADYQIAEDLLLMVDVENSIGEWRETQQHGKRALTEASIPHLLSQPEEFVLYPPQCVPADRRPDDLGVFFAPKTGECTV
jgi:hypothetical protein